MKKKMAICLVITLCFLSVALPSRADKEYLYPEDDAILDEWDDGTGGGTNCWSEVDDDVASLSEADYCATNSTAQNDAEGNITNTSLTGGDTINWVQYHVRAREAGGPENVSIRFVDSTGETCDTNTIQSTTFTTVDSSQHNVACDGSTAWTTTILNSLEYDFLAGAAGKNDGTSWEVAWFYYEVDYTPSGGGSRRVFTVSWIPEEERIIDKFIKGIEQWPNQTEYLTLKKLDQKSL